MADMLFPDRVRELSFSLAVKPKGQGRARFGNGRAYTPTATRKYVAAIRERAESEWNGREPLSGAIVVHVHAEFLVPARARKQSRQHHTQRPDGDNIAKAVLDALNKVIFADDCQVVLLQARKSWSVVGDALHVAIWSVE